MKKEKTLRLILIGLLFLSLLTLSSCASTDHSCAAYASHNVK